MSEAPDVSVVMALADHYGHAPETVEAYTRHQTLAPDRYELVITHAPADDDAAAAVAPLLRPHDRLLPQPPSPRFGLYDAGARAARAKWLFFSDPHIVPEPSMLETVLDHLAASPDSSGCCVRTIPFDEDRWVGYCEGRMYHEGFAIVAHDGPQAWQRVSIRGTAIARDAYFDVGGFDLTVGWFGEMALAASLDRAGHHLGVADTGLRHYNAEKVAELFRFVREYRQGEQLWRTRVGAEIADRYGASAPAPLPSRADAIAMARAGLSVRTVPALLDIIRPGLSGRASAWRTYLTARARLALPTTNNERRYARFVKAWDASGRLGVTAAPATDTAAADGPEVRLADADPDGLVGFHEAESHGGVRFRWAAPLALVRMPVPGGDVAVDIDTGGLRPLPAGAVTVTIDGRAAAQVDVDRWQITLPPGTPVLRRIVLASRRLASPTDPRALGVPVVAMRVSAATNVGATAGGSDRRALEA